MDDMQHFIFDHVESEGFGVPGGWEASRSKRVGSRGEGLGSMIFL